MPLTRLKLVSSDRRVTAVECWWSTGSVSCVTNYATTLTTATWFCCAYSSAVWCWPLKIRYSPTSKETRQASLHLRFVGEVWQTFVRDLTQAAHRPLTLRNSQQRIINQSINQPINHELLEWLKY